MANEFFTILTATGRNKLAAATATGTPLTLTQMAVGDGDNGAYYSPTEAQTALKHEVWRGAINHLAVDANNPNWIVAELVIPDNVGGFYIREVGLFDSAGAMIAVGKFPESYKPTLAAGSNKQLYVRMILEVANTSAVTLLVDPSVVLATRQYCDDKVADELNKRDGKQSVRVATTAAIALAGLQTIDGVVLVAGDRVLVKDQAAGVENGIYVVAVGAWARATDADSGTKLTAGALVPVEGGTVNADTIWMLKTDGAIIVGATPIAFQWAGGLNAPTQAAGDNSAKIANTSFVQAAIAALVASSPAALDTLNELAAAIGNDANFATTITNLIAGKVSKSGDTMTGPLYGRSGAASPSNANSAGFCFAGDPDSGMFNSADGVLQLATNGQVFLENSAGGALKVLKQLRVPKGAPTAADLSTSAGYTFNDDGDTGLFAEGGSANSGSDLVFRIDNGEVARFKTAMKSTFGSGWARLSSGIIIQWGSFVQTDTGSAVNFTWIFPIAFPNAALQGFITVGSSIGGGAINCSIEGFNSTGASGFTLGPAGSRTYRIFAIGH
ncbi:phage tail protein [Burkholderia cenocepacia]|uniref:phage tail protein n=1 Tax=Burkholderia cenocepacia TaxID=95486 RepID=UPI0020115778|nr:phage tail protein [Burkholderia cenocepacia]